MIKILKIVSVDGMVILHVVAFIAGVVIGNLVYTAYTKKKSEKNEAADQKIRTSNNQYDQQKCKIYANKRVEKQN